jgi:hypothetical protein
VHRQQCDRRTIQQKDQCKSNGSFLAFVIFRAKPTLGEIVYIWTVSPNVVGSPISCPISLLVSTFPNLLKACFLNPCLSSHDSHEREVGGYRGQKVGSMLKVPARCPLYWYVNDLPFINITILFSSRERHLVTCAHGKPRNPFDSLPETRQSDTCRASAIKAIRAQRRGRQSIDCAAIALSMTRDTQPSRPSLDITRHENVRTRHQWSTKQFNIATAMQALQVSARTGVRERGNQSRSCSSRKLNASSSVSSRPLGTGVGAVFTNRAARDQGKARSLRAIQFPVPRSSDLVVLKKSLHAAYSLMRTIDPTLPDLISCIPAKRGQLAIAKTSRRSTAQRCVPAFCFRKLTCRKHPCTHDLDRSP